MTIPYLQSDLDEQRGFAPESIYVFYHVDFDINNIGTTAQKRRYTPEQGRNAMPIES